MTSLDIPSFINKLCNIYLNNFISLKHFICIDRHLKTVYDVCVTTPHLVYNQHITREMIFSTQNMYSFVDHC